MYRHNHVFGQKPRCPAIFGEKSAVFARFGPFFTENRGAPRFLTQFVVMPIHLLDPTQNYNNTWGILKIPPSGRKRGPFLQDLAAKSPKKEGTVTKKGGKKIFSPPKWLPPSDAKFDVDYDSAIKHDLIFFDQVMGIYSFALKGEIALTSQNHLHTLTNIKPN